MTPSRQAQRGPQRGAATRPGLRSAAVNGGGERRRRTAARPLTNEKGSDQFQDPWPCNGTTGVFLNDVLEDAAITERRRRAGPGRPVSGRAGRPFQGVDIPNPNRKGKAPTLSTQCTCQAGLQPFDSSWNRISGLFVFRLSGRNRA